MSAYTMDDFRAEFTRRRGRSPKLVEKHQGRSRARGDRREFFRDLVRRAKARIRELRDLDPNLVMPCPWAAAIGGECWGKCPCGGRGTVTAGGGRGTVTAGFMVDHYWRTVFDYRGFR